MRNANLPAMPICYDARLMAAYTKQEAQGLTKREMFAMAAMQGIAGESDTPEMSKSIARIAVSHADALLAELESTK